MDAISKPAAWRRDEGCDMTAMVDVTFLLLIFFMVTASFTLHRAIAMPLQTSSLASPATIDSPELETIFLKVDRWGGFYLATVQGEHELVGKQALITGLKQAAAITDADARLEISVDSDARLQSMVDAIDAATIAGIGRLTVLTTDEHLATRLR